MKDLENLFNSEYDDYITQDIEMEVSLPKSLQPNPVEKLVSSSLQSVKQDIEQKPSESLYGLAKGAVEGSAGLAGDLISLVKGVYYATQTPEGKSKLDEFVRGAESATGLPTTEDVQAFLNKLIPESSTSGAEGLGQLLAPTSAIKPAVKMTKAATKTLKAKK